MYDEEKDEDTGGTPEDKRRMLLIVFGFGIVLLCIVIFSLFQNNYHGRSKYAQCQNTSMVSIPELVKTPNPGNPLDKQFVFSYESPSGLLVFDNGDGLEKREIPPETIHHYPTDSSGVMRIYLDEDQCYVDFQIDLTKPIGEEVTLKKR